MLGDVNALQTFLEQNQSICLYGAGELGKAVLAYINRHNLNSRISCMLDKNDGTVIDGTPVKNLDALLVYPQAAVLVTANRRNHEEMTASLSGYSPVCIEFLSENLSEKLLRDNHLPTLDDLEEFERRRLRFVPKPCLEYMVLNILDHCNLRCKGCDHFACISDPYFVPFETIQRDLRRLSDILGGSYIMSMGVMGGEPLLHPDLLVILTEVRRFFPHVKIRLTSNGLLMLKQAEEFWRVCRENRVTIVLTKYPINLDYDKIKAKAAKEQVLLHFFEGTGDGVVKKSFKKIIDINGLNDPVASFSKCHVANYGNFLMEGKFYGCPFSCQSSRIFNRKFGQKLELMEEDYLDIYQIKNKKELFEFAARPKYYCRYCGGLQKEQDWERSKQEITEWVER